MKTLDEVITAFEKADVRWSNDPHNPIEYPDFRDALKYLRELKLFRQTPIMQGIHKAQRDCALYPVNDWGEDEKERE